MKEQTVTLQEAFEMSGGQCILVLKHSLNGLPKGAVLTTELGNRWQVLARLQFEHALDIHRYFEAETINYMKARFETPKAEIQNRALIQAQESQGIFEYLTEALDIVQSPKPGTLLSTLLPDN